MGSAFGLAYLWRFGVADGAAEFSFSSSGTGLELALKLALLALIMFAFCGGMFLAHELCHVIGYPRMGFSRHSIIGVWPSKFLGYAAYQGSLRRNRLLGVLLLPMLLMSLLPLAFGTFVRPLPPVAALISVFNMLGCGGDVMIAFILLSQVPSQAILRDQGWDSWWKVVPKNEAL
jgi:hypothetical protein